MLIRRKGNRLDDAAPAQSCSNVAVSRPCFSQRRDWRLLTMVSWVVGLLTRNANNNIVTSGNDLFNVCDN